MLIKNWEGVVIHHSASHDVSANEIDTWHKERGWKGVGYHYVVRFDGAIEPARNWAQAGAHKKGYNAHYLGICVTGDFTKHPPTRQQLASVIDLVRGHDNRWDIRDNIDRHHEDCPGKYFPWEFFIENLKRKER